MYRTMPRGFFFVLFKKGRTSLNSLRGFRQICSPMSFAGESSQVANTMENAAVNGSETQRVPKKVTLVSSDGETFEVEETAVLESELLKNLIEDGCADEEIPLGNVTGAILAKVIEYCKNHAGGKDEAVKKWDAEFIQEADLNTLYHLMMAGHYMSIKGLMELGAQRVADMIKGKTVEEMRETLQIKNDMTPGEEQSYRGQYPWAFQD